MADSKDTIYVDIDDEITSIIEKVRSSRHKIIALVLPKRAAMLQSIVNMKLLKRTATEANKHLVLITSETALVSLAGAVGLYVAKNLQSKPGIPAAPDVPASSEMTVTDPGADESEVDPTKSVGELAGLPPGDAEETIEVDDPEADTAVVAAAGAEVAAKPKNKKLKIPNFNRFRVGVFLGIVLLVALVVGWYVAFMVLPKASVTIKTDTSTIPTSLTLTLSASAKQLDTTKLIVPVELKEVKKTDTEKVPATGQKDKGTKATGTIVIYNCNQNDTLGGVSHVVPAGTGVSTGGLTFITQADVTVAPSHFSGSTCKYDLPSSTVNVTSQAAGDQYNLSARSHAYAVANFPAMIADGSAMSGGTSQIVSVVSGADIDAAKQKLANRSTPAATTELKNDLQADGVVPLTDSLLVSDPVITNTPNIGDESPDVTVTQVVTYDMVGVKQDYLDQLVKASASKQIDPTKQIILDTGIGAATWRVVNRSAPGELQAALQTQVTAGPELIIANLQKDVAGKKRGDVISSLQSRPGIKEVTVTYSPFWVSTTPKKTSKITINIEQTNVSPSPTTSANP